LSQDDQIRKYLSNNTFVKESNWNDLAINQLFMVEILGKGITNTEPNKVQDIINLQMPAERFEYQTQNLFNQTRYALTGATRDMYRISFIENKSYDQRSKFMIRNDLNITDGSIPSSSGSYETYSKTIKTFPAERYFDLIVYMLKKDFVKDEWYYPTSFTFKDCMVETINDIDFSVDKMEMIKCELTGRMKTIIVTQHNRS